MSTSVLKTRASFGNAALPKAQPTDQERAILALAPSLWLEVDDAYCRTNGDGSFRDIQCRAGGRRYAPMSPLVPSLVAAGTRKSLRFAKPAANLSQALGPSDGAPLFTNPKTFSWVSLFRLQAVAGAGDGLAGGSRYSASFMLWQDNNNNGQCQYFPASVSAAYGENAANRQDYVWHSWVISVDASGATKHFALRVDAMPIYAGAVDATMPYASEIIYMGGSGPGGQKNGYVGEQALLMHIPGIALAKPGNEPALALIEGYAAALAAART